MCLIECHAGFNPQRRRKQFFIRYFIILPTPPEAVYYSLWIGLVDHNISGRWAWLDGTPIDFMKWGHYQPDYQAAQHMNLTCTVLVITGIQKFNSYESDDTAQWNDDNCEMPDWPNFRTELELWKDKPGEEGVGVHDGVFCQKQLEHKETTTQNPEISELYCGNDWAYYDLTNSCYLVIYDSIDYFTADDTCRGMNATLASVRNQLENNFIAGLITNNMSLGNNVFWIGMTDIWFSLVYKWDDGSTIPPEGQAIGPYWNWGYYGADHDHLNMSITCGQFEGDGNDMYRKEQSARNPPGM
uniref:C-type lectin domain-containing protein n=1 Tax=Acrobeloides nanus TaxID=290746 RepID=A0A914CKG5_9BILA